MLVFVGITLALLMAVVLALVGTMREVVVLQGRTDTLTELLLKPPEPTFPGGVLPDSVADRLQSMAVEPPGDSFLIFLSKGCSGCSHLVQAIRGAISSNIANRSNFVCVIGAKSAGGSFEQSIADLSVAIVVDHDGQLMKSCQIQATPTIVHLQDKTLRVLGAAVGEGFDWILPRLRQQDAEVRAVP